MSKAEETISNNLPLDELSKLNEILENQKSDKKLLLKILDMLDSKRIRP